MVKAIKELREGRMGLKRAVKQFGVPRSTLRRFVHSDLSPEEAVSNCLSKKFVRRPTERVARERNDSSQLCLSLCEFGMDVKNEPGTDEDDPLN